VSTKCVSGLCVALALFSAACSSTDSTGTSNGVNAAPDGKAWKTLEEWKLFADAPKQEPANGVIPYEVNAPLFSDYAAKHRFIYVPDGKKIGYSDTDTWSFPVGTILVKTFSYYA